jgi:hypothetical protein
MVIVLITIVIMGGLCEDFMTFLGIRMNVDEAEYMKTWHRQRKLKGRFLHFGTSLREKIKMFSGYTVS